MILLLILDGITRNTTSGDVIALAIYAAQDRCEELGIDEAIFKDTVAKFVKFSEVRKRTNPFAY